MRPIVSSLVALSLLAASGSAFASPANEPLVYSQRGVVLAPKDGRIDVSARYRSVTVSVDADGYTRSLSRASLYLLPTVAWSPLNHWEIGLGPIGYATGDLEDALVVLSSLWTRYRFVDTGNFQLAGELDFDNTINLGVSMRLFFSLATSLGIHPEFQIGVDGDSNALNVDVELAHNFTPQFYGAAILGSRAALDVALQTLTAGLAVGYSFGGGPDAFIDLELSGRYMVHISDNFDEESVGVDETRVEFTARFHL